MKIHKYGEESEEIYLFTTMAMILFLFQEIDAGNQGNNLNCVCLINILVVYLKMALNLMLWIQKVEVIGE